MSVSIDERGMVRYLIKEVEKIRCACEEEKAKIFTPCQIPNYMPGELESSV